MENPSFTGSAVWYFIIVLDYNDQKQTWKILKKSREIVKCTYVLSTYFKVTELPHCSAWLMDIACATKYLHFIANVAVVFIVEITIAMIVNSSRARMHPDSTRSRPCLSAFQRQK